MVLTHCLVLKMFTVRPHVQIVSMKSLAECWTAACDVAQTAVSSVNCVSVTLTVSRHDCCKIANKLLAVLEPYIDACSITVPPPMVNYSTVVDVEQGWS